MLKDYPEFKRGEVEKVYKKLSKAEKEHLEEYLTYRQARGLKSKDKVNDVRRYLLHLRHILQKDLRTIDYKEFISLLAIINQSHLSNNAKNHIKVDLRNFLKYSFDDWSKRFHDFDDVNLDSSGNEERINSKTIFPSKDINLLEQEEKNVFWRAFLLTQYEGGLRTIEVRTIKWEDIKFNVDGEISEINIYSTKTGHSRTTFVERATYYLKRLKAEQENLDNKGVYVFHQKSDKNKPIDKYSVSSWFRRLTRKALGREGWCYLLRHSRATELYRLAKENKISKDTAIKFMGHSKDMSNKYTHLDKEDVKKMLKSQVYNKELSILPEKKKHELELQIEEQQKKINELIENKNKVTEALVVLGNKIEEISNQSEGKKTSKPRYSIVTK